MRAAPGRASAASRVIARICKRVGVTFALVVARSLAEQGEFRVNPRQDRPPFSGSAHICARCLREVAFR
jgi:hypothetical protein